jgi:hypothetical protein
VLLPHEILVEGVNDVNGIEVLEELRDIVVKWMEIDIAADEDDDRFCGIIAIVPIVGSPADTIADNTSDGTLFV